jgi:nucleoside triphosphatase
MKQRVIVGAIITKGDDYILITQNKPNSAYPDMLVCVGGGVESGEDLEEAMRREIREEIGIEVAHLRPVGFDSVNLSHYKGEPHQLIFLNYVAEYSSGDLVAGDDAASVVFVNKSQINQANLAPPTRKLAEQAGIIQ